MRTLLLFALTAWALPVFAQVVIYDPYLGAVVPVYPYPYAGGPSPCVPKCIYEGRNRIQERRRARFDALRADEPAAASVPAPTGVPLTQSKETRESDILPEYQAASRLRDDFSVRGKPLPEFDNRGKVLPQYEDPAPTPPAAAAKSSAAPQASTPPPVPAPAKRPATPMVPCPKAAREC